ncbi:MAG: YhbY family RNA-binding protein [Deltaproteobacteria bacterium]|nr:YhbY family RNA-binding protein [Deltaproteobacteria bacterium]
MAALTSRQVAFLKALAHEQKPVILLGRKGITEAVVKETASALEIHELIKVRLATEEKDSLDDEALAMAGKTGAALVDRRGKVATLYRRRSSEPTIVLPKEPK